jgi:hypothetical protein
VSQQTSIRCDECGRIKTETNHWFKLAETPASFILWPATDCPTTSVPLDDLCSYFCARARMSRWAERLSPGGGR